MVGLVAGQERFGAALFGAPQVALGLAFFVLFELAIAVVGVGLQQQRRQLAELHGRAAVDVGAHKVLVAHLAGEDEAAQVLVHAFGARKVLLRVAAGPGALSFPHGQLVPADHACELAHQMVLFSCFFFFLFLFCLSCCCAFVSFGPFAGPPIGGWISITSATTQDE